MEVPFTVPFSAVDCPPVSDVVVGLSVTFMVGISAIVALALLEGSTTLFAVNVIFCELERVIGTVYTPPEVIVPMAGKDHTMPVFAAPVTEAVKAADWPLVIDIHVGLTEILTNGIRLTLAESTGRLGLVAKMVTVLAAVIVAGAVYNPDAEIWPTPDGLVDQV